MNGIKFVQEKNQMWSTSLNLVADNLYKDESWAEAAAYIESGNSSDRALHLAVFVEPFLEFMLSGRKTVESRFSAVRFPPFQRVARGDLVLLKKSGGPVVGICEIGAAWYYELDPATWNTIKMEFSTAICADTPEFWDTRSKAKYASLMFVSRVCPLPAIDWPKRDRRGWVVVRDRMNDLLSGDPMKNTVIGFSGGIASGKSTLSEAVAASLRCPRVSFGQAIRVEAEQRGLKPDRITLQTIGEELIQENPELLCRSVLAQADWSPGMPLVIDGIRHVAVARCIRKLVDPSAFHLVHVAAKQQNRLHRICERGDTESDLRKLDSHSTETEVHKGLPKIADIVINGNRSLESSIEEVCSWASSLNSQ